MTTEVKTKKEDKWEPRIVGFLCKWCSYAGADLAGISRYKYPATATFIKVPCSGRVDPTFIYKAFKEGADAVLIAGCHPGDCHYIEGNYKTMRRFELLKRTLEQMGIEEKRLRLEWISASEAMDVKKVITEMHKDIKQLGPIELPQLKPFSMEEE